MGDYTKDKSIPLDFTGLNIIERHGYTEAVCQGCFAWIRTGKYYQGHQVVTHSVPHTAPCKSYEDYIASVRDNFLAENVQFLLNKPTL